MKKVFTAMLLTTMAMTAFAQEQNDTTYVMLDFTANPWNYPVTEVEKGWAPSFSDLESPGSILEATDFSWSLQEGSTEKVKVTLYPDWEETYKAPVYGRIEPGEAESVSLGVNAGKINILYTTPGTTMQFESPAGYKFGKMVFYTYRSSNILVGDEYEEEFEYTYNGTVFKQNLKVWKPTSPQKNQYGYDIWKGDDTNILFNYPYFSAHFVKIDIRLVPDGSAGIGAVTALPNTHKATTLDGRTIDSSKGLGKGIYIIDGRKHVVK